MDLEFVFMFLAVSMVICAIIWVGVAILTKQQKKENDAKPVNTEMAKLVDMQRVDSDGIIIGEIWVLFELESGERIRLNAKPQNHLVVGDVGMLTWQGNRIHRFERKQ